MSLTHILKVGCKQFGCKDNYKIAKLYNKNGIQLFNDDIILLAGGDMLYLGSKGKECSDSSFVGEDFYFSAILDDYQIIRELGQGGFGMVVLGKHKEDGKEVAIKFMDVSESCNYSLYSLFSAIRLDDPEHLQGGRVSQEAPAQEHHPTLPRLRREQTAYHDHGVRRWW